MAISAASASRPLQVDQQPTSSSPSKIQSFLSKPLQYIGKKVNEFVTHLAFGDQFKELEQRSNRYQELKGKCTVLDSKIKQLKQELWKGDIFTLKKDFEAKSEELKTAQTALEEQVQLFVEKEAYLNDSHKLQMESLQSKIQELELECRELEFKIKDLESKSQEYHHLVAERKDVLSSQKMLEGYSISTRLDSLKEHTDGLTISQKLKVAVEITAAKIALVRPFLMKNVIHPATDLLSLKALQNPKKNSYQTDVAETMVNFSTLVDEGQVKKISFYTEDHQQLDGCVVYGGDPPVKDDSRPVMVMVSGNMETYEQKVSLAQEYAKKYNINVVLYNPRGVGHSLGKEQSTGQAVKDCKAVILEALKMAGNDPKRMVVHGHSLGGGISSTALKSLIKSGKLPVGGIGLYINSHSFTSILGTAAEMSKELPSEGILGAVKKINILKVGPSILKLLGLNALNSEKNIFKYQLANRVVVLTAEKDTVISGIAQLGPSLIANEKTILISVPVYGHNEGSFEYANKNYFDREQEWRDKRAPASEENKNAAKASLEEYEKHFQNWRNGLENENSSPK